MKDEKPRAPTNDGTRGVATSGAPNDGAKPRTIVLIGRPNVGKSSLFNALLGYRRTIVFDEAGTTTDFVREPLRSCGGQVELVDMQGIWDENDGAWLERAIEIADAILFVVDAGAGTTPFDRWIASKLPREGKPVLLIANKQDVTDAQNANEYAELGFTSIVGVSVVHRRGMDEVEDWLVGFAGGLSPEELNELRGPEAELELAIVGRPNVGKSTIMNWLCGTEVSKVSPIAFTTRDPVSFVLQTPKGLVRILDTAGQRRPRSEKTGIEEFAGQFSRRAIERAHVVLLVLPLHDTVSDQDMRLMNLAIRAGKPLAILFNFCDLVPDKRRAKAIDDSEFRAALEPHWRLFISGKSGENLNRILPLAFRLRRDSERRVRTSELNRFIEELKIKNPPPTRGRKAFNMLYASQVRSAPPTFVVFMNRKEALPESYKKFVENSLRKRLRLVGQPIRLYFRGGESRE